MPKAYIRKVRSRPNAPAGAALAFIRAVVADPPAGCAMFPFNEAGSGYGMCYHEGRRIMAHRLAFEMANGPIPPGMFVLHGQTRPCEGRRCCNPRHLRVGTLQDNAADRMRDGTTAVGSAQGLSKLTEADIPKIRDRHAAGEMTGQIAREFGVTRGTIRAAVKRRTWAHVP